MRDFRVLKIYRSSHTASGAVWDLFMIWSAMDRLPVNFTGLRMQYGSGIRKPSERAGPPRISEFVFFFLRNMTKKSVERLQG